MNRPTLLLAMYRWWTFEIATYSYISCVRVSLYNSIMWGLIVWDNLTFESIYPLIVLGYPFTLWLYEISFYFFIVRLSLYTLIILGYPFTPQLYEVIPLHFDCVRLSLYIWVLWGYSFKLWLCEFIPLHFNPFILRLC